MRSPSGRSARRACTSWPTGSFDQCSARPCRTRSCAPSSRASVSSGGDLARRVRVPAAASAAAQSAARGPTTAGAVNAAVNLAQPFCDLLGHGGVQEVGAADPRGARPAAGEEVEVEEGGRARHGVLHGAGVSFARQHRIDLGQCHAAGADDDPGQHDLPAAVPRLHRADRPSRTASARPAGATRISSPGRSAAAAACRWSARRGRRTSARAARATRRPGTAARRR